MEPPPGSPREDTASQSLGVDEFRGERQDAKPAVTSVTGGDVEKALLSETERAATAEGEESHGGAGASGRVDEIQKGGGGEPPQQPQEARAATGRPQPQDRQQQRLRPMFARLELKELESIFQRAQYPDVFARKDLAICMDVTQAKAQVSKLDKSNVAGQPF